MADNFGERAATEEEVEAWKALVRAGRRAVRGMRFDADAERKGLHRLPVRTGA